MSGVSPTKFNGGDSGVHVSGSWQKGRLNVWCICCNHSGQFGILLKSPYRIENGQGLQNIKGDRFLTRSDIFHNKADKRGGGGGEKFKSLSLVLCRFHANPCIRG